MTADPRSRGNSVLMGSALVLILAGLTYLSIELIQRKRFNDRKGQVERFFADLQSQITFELGPNQKIRIPEGGKGGVSFLATTGDNEGRTSRTVTWFVSFVGANPAAPSGKSRQTVLTMTLVQERRWVLGSPYLLMDQSKLCEPSVSALVEATLRSHDLSTTAQSGF